MEHEYEEVHLVFENPQSTAVIFVKGKHSGDAFAEARSIALTQFPELSGREFLFAVSTSQLYPGENKVVE